jgi:hypothetical protein
MKQRGHFALLGSVLIIRAAAAQTVGALPTTAPAGTATEGDAEIVARFDAFQKSAADARDGFAAGLDLTLLNAALTKQREAAAAKDDKAFQEASVNVQTQWSALGKSLDGAAIKIKAARGAGKDVTDAFVGAADRDKAEAEEVGRQYIKQSTDDVDEAGRRVKEAEGQSDPEALAEAQRQFEKAELNRLSTQKAIAEGIKNAGTDDATANLRVLDGQLFENYLAVRELTVVVKFQERDAARVSRTAIMAANVSRLNDVMKTMNKRALSPAQRASQEASAEWLRQRMNAFRTDTAGRATAQPVLMTPEMRRELYKSHGLTLQPPADVGKPAVPTGGATSAPAQAAR